MNLRLWAVFQLITQNIPISMLVIRPHKLPATIGMLSKEVNQLIEWLLIHRKK